MSKRRHENGSTLAEYTWEEVQKHTAVDDRWIVVDDVIYDVTNWARKHPGGARILGHFKGQDATEAWRAMHPRKDLVDKYMKPLVKGRVVSGSKPKPISSLEDDFEDLRQAAEEMEMFKSQPLFYSAHLGSIVACEIIAYLIMANYGSAWLPWVAGVLVHVVAQAQAGWSQHDYGHLSVFKSRALNHRMHEFIIGHLKGASSHWWNFRHFQHHVKPNVHRKDPDVCITKVLLLGDVLPVQFGKEKKGDMPYQWQHTYFTVLFTSLLLPIYFHYENLYFVIKRRNYRDLAWMLSFFVRWFYFYAPVFGFWNSFGLYLFIRTVESHWFTWCTQMSHIPMDVDNDQHRDWFRQQLISTCDVAPSPIFDWFSGHLNFQIEHHLFPTMPRHNLPKMAPLVKSLCRKHDVKYTCKSGWIQAFGDVIRSLKKSGGLWFEAYYDL